MGLEVENLPNASDPLALAARRRQLARKSGVFANAPYAYGAFACGPQGAYFHTPATPVNRHASTQAAASRFTPTQKGGSEASLSVPNRTDPGPAGRTFAYTCTRLRNLQGELGAFASIRSPRKGRGDGSRSGPAGAYPKRSDGGNTWVTGGDVTDR